MDLNGTFYNAQKPVATKYTAPTFDASDLKGKEAAAYVSDYLINTMFESSFSTGNELDITALLAKLNITVTTDDIEVAIPGIVAKYGSGKNVTIAAKYVGKQSELHVKAASGLGLDLSLLIDLSVGGDNALHVTLDSINAAVLL